MKAHLKRLVALAVAIGALAAVPGTASAAVCDYVTDSAGYTWDIGLGAYVSDGPNAGLGLADAFDRFGYMSVSANGGTSFGLYANAADTCSVEDNGREVVYPDNTTAVPGITMSRKVYVPATGTPFLRYVDVVTNTTSNAQTIVYRFGGNFGSDDDTKVAATSNGDLVRNEQDSWASTYEDYPNSTDPRITNAWDGTSEPVQRAAKVGSFSLTNPGYAEPYVDDFVVEYSVALAPGETKRYMHLVGLRHTADEQAAAGPALGSETDEFRVGLTEAEEDNIQNWVFDQDHDGVLNRADNCPAEPNGGQENLDGDAKGDACDEDVDNDGLANSIEQTLRTDQRKVDSDGDGVSDISDSCPTLAAATEDGCPVPTQPVVTTGGGAEVDKTAPVATVGVAKKLSLKKLVRKGIVVKLGSNEPASFDVEVAAAAKSARLAQVGDLIVSAKTLAIGSGTRSVKLTIAKKFRKALTAKSRLRLKVVATDAAGNRSVSSVAVRLGR